jgi:hypothetical protein
VVQAGHQEQVLLAGEQVVDGGELAGDADRGPDGVRLPGQVVARDLDLAAVGADQGGQDVDGGGLAGAVGPSSEKIVPSGTSRSMPSSTSWSPNDLRSPVARIAGRDGMVVMLLVSFRWLWWPPPVRGCAPPGSPRFQRGFRAPASG